MISGKFNPKLINHPNDNSDHVLQIILFLCCTQNSTPSYIRKKLVVEISVNQH